MGCRGTFICSLKINLLKLQYSLQGARLDITEETWLPPTLATSTATWPETQMGLGVIMVRWSSAGEYFYILRRFETNRSAEKTTFKQYCRRQVQEKNNKWRRNSTQRILSYILLGHIRRRNWLNLEAAEKLGCSTPNIYYIQQIFYGETFLGL